MFTKKKKKKEEKNVEKSLWRSLILESRRQGPQVYCVEQHVELCEPSPHILWWMISGIIQIFPKICPCLHILIQSQTHKFLHDFPVSGSHAVLLFLNFAVSKLLTSGLAASFPSEFVSVGWILWFSFIFVRRGKCRTRQWPQWGVWVLWQRGLHRFGVEGIVDPGFLSRCIGWECLRVVLFRRIRYLGIRGKIVWSFLYAAEGRFWGVGVWERGVRALWKERMVTG